MSKRMKNLMAREMVAEFSEHDSCVVVSMGAVDVLTVTELRNALREKGVKFTVVKNRVARHAVAEIGWNGVGDFLSGQSAVAYGEGGALAASKVLTDWEKKVPKGIVIRGGFLEGKALKEDDVRQLATVPDKPVLYAMLASLVAAPVTQVVSLISELVADVARAVGAVADKQGGSGEEPAR